MTEDNICVGQKRSEERLRAKVGSRRATELLEKMAAATLNKKEEEK